MSNMGQAIFWAILLCTAQSPVKPTPVSAAPLKMDSVSALVKDQFGPSFSIPGKFSKVMISADFDNDGVEDVAIIADSRDPIPDSFDYKYTVADPYYSYFGQSNPAETAVYGRADAGRNHDLLVIFGAGSDSWHNATPKAKFVLINVPFDEINVGRM